MQIVQRPGAVGGAGVPATGRRSTHGVGRLAQTVGGFLEITLRIASAEALELTCELLRLLGNLSLLGLPAALVRGAGALCPLTFDLLLLAPSELGQPLHGFIHGVVGLVLALPPHRLVLIVELVRLPLEHLLELGHVAGRATATAATALVHRDLHIQEQRLETQ